MKSFYSLRTRAAALLFLLFSAADNVYAQNIITIGGVGTSSFSGDGGLATAAELAQPVSVARDASGNVYIADQGNHRIRKITYSSGTISTIAGTTTSGFSGDGGAASSAQLYYPAGIAVDGSGNIYIADQGNQRIRKITASTGIISTIAGTGTAGFSGDGGAATSAKLDNPVSVAVDGSGNIFISDQYNQRIRKITASTGNISTIAGTGMYSYSGDGGAATAATFQNPAGLEVDASGNIYVADLFNHVVRKITASTGNISTIAGNGTAGFSGDGSTATSANLNYPTDVAFDDSGNIFIATQYSHRIRKVTAATGNISTIIGTGTAGYSGDGGPATGAQINYPTGIASDGGGNIYIADRENHRIRFVCNYTIKPTVTSLVNYCVGASATALTASGSSLKWFTTPLGIIGSTTAPIPSTASAGTTKYYVAAISPYGCEGPRDSITVIVNALPTKPIVTDTIIYCVGASTTTLSATGTGLLWYTTATGGTGTDTAPTPATSTAGVTNYYVSQTNATTSCESQRAKITVIVNASTPAPTATTSVIYCEGASAIPLTATGTSLLWYNTATGGTGSTTAITPATATSGTTTYYVSQTSTCGESARTAITVTVNTKPAAPTVITPISYCQSASATALSATGTSLKWYTSAAGGTGSSTAITPSTTTAGTTTYYVSQTNTSGCESDRASIAVTINPAPAKPTVSSPVNYCVGATSTTLSATGTSLKWYTVSTGGLAASSAPTPTTSTAGTTTYYVSQTSADGCEGLRAAIVVVVNPLPAAPIVTATINLCEGYTAAALSATGTSLLWYTSASGGSGISTAPIPSTTATGTTIFYVSQTTSCGESPRASITVNVNPTPAAPTVITPITYCQGDTALGLSASGTSLKWYATATGGTGSTGIPTPGTGSSGTTTFYVSQTNSYGCESPRSSITIIIKAAPAAPLVVSPVNYCVGATAATLSATGTSLLWYTSASGGTGSGTAPTPSTLVAGSTTYYVSQTNDTSGCKSLRAAIVVNVFGVPAKPTVVSPVNYCVGASSSALSASGTSLLWYTAATGGTGATVAPIPSTATAGTFKYFVSQNSAYGCGESVRDSITVNVNPVPATPTLITPLNYCLGDTASALSATGTSLKWYNTRSGGTASTTAPIPGTGSAGTFKYYVSQTNASNCESARDSITVTINAKPAAPTVTSPVAYCVGAVATALSASGTSLKWYTTASGGTSSTATPIPATTTAGITTYYVSQTSGLSCEGPRAAIVVTINAIPAKPTFTSPVNYCLDASAVALSASGSSLKWYTSASGGTASGTAPTPSTTSTGTTKFYVSQTVLSCESAIDSITLNVNPKPVVPTVTSPVTYCTGDTATVLSATGTSLKWYTTASGGTGSATAPKPSTAIAGTFKFYVSQTNSFTCEGPRDSITVTVNASPLAPTVSSPVEYCSGSTTTALSATGTSLKWYTSASGGVASTTAPTPGTSATGTTTYYVSQTSSLGCESPRAAINVIVYATPSAPTVGFFIILCLGETRTLTASGSGLKWYSAATGGTGSTTAPTPSTATPGTEYFYVSQTSSAGCEGPRATIRVSVDTILSAPKVTSPVAYCVGEKAVPLVASGTAWHWYKDSPTGTFTTTAPTPSTAVSGTTKYYVCRISSAGCEGYKDSISVVVNPLPAAPTVTTPVSYCDGVIAIPLSAVGTNLKWYNVASGGASSATAPTPSTATTGFTTYYVSQTSSLGCESPRAAIVVEVTTKPDVKISAIGSAYFVYCKNDSVKLSATSSVGLSYYQWYREDTLISGATASIYKAFRNGNYKVVVKNLNGCDNNTSVYVFADTLPEPTLSPVELQFCPNVNIVLFCKPVSTLYTYEWFKDSALVAGASGSQLIINKAGNYYVMVTNNLGCIRSTNHSVATTYPAIFAPRIIRTDPLLRLSASFAKYQWYRNGKLIVGANSISYTMPFGGKYFCEVSDVNDCTTQSDTIDTDNTSSIQTISSRNNLIKIYPNPTRSLVNIEAAFDVTVSVTDATGKILLKEKQVKIIDLSPFADGIYIFTITDIEGNIIGIEKINKFGN